MSPGEAAGRLLMVGAGNMGGAMLRRWLATGLDAEQVTVVSPSGRAMPDGVQVVDAIPAGPFDTVLLGFKPQQLPALRPALARLVPPRLLVSILAGVELATLERLCGADAVARALPNLPVALGKGVTLLAATAEEARLDTLMAPLGLVEWVDEARFDVATALAGSGPGFLYRWIDAMAAAGAALGLPVDQATRLSLATVEGSALLAAAADVGPATLADRVASPKGSTREGLDVLDRDDALVTLLTQVLAAAARRNGAMAMAARGPD